jgi:hypothetical protein
MASRIERHNLTFIHVPKTGGVWVDGALKASGLSIKRFGHEHGSLDRLNYEEETLAGLLPYRISRLYRKFLSRSGIKPPTTRRFCIVRHPLRWYESWWKYNTGLDWPEWGRDASATYWHPNSILNGCGSPDFNEFVRNVIARRPGYVSELFASYAKPGVEWIGKTESLADDIVSIVRDAKLEFDETALRAHPRANESKTPGTEANWDPDLRDLVMRLELPALTHFGYLTAEECLKYGVPHGTGLHPGLVSK